MKLRTAILLAVCWLGIACSRASQAVPSPLPSTQSAARTSPKSYDENATPSRKEIIRALLTVQDVSLSADSSCSNVGTSPSDADIGDYISGFLAEQNFIPAMRQRALASP